MRVGVPPSCCWIRRRSVRHQPSNLTPAHPAPPPGRVATCLRASARAGFGSSAPRRCAATSLAPLPRLRAARTRSGSRAVMRAARSALPGSSAPAVTASAAHRPAESQFGGSQGAENKGEPWLAAEVGFFAERESERVSERYAKQLKASLRDPAAKPLRGSSALSLTAVADAAAPALHSPLRHGLRCRE